MFRLCIGDTVVAGVGIADGSRAKCDVGIGPGAAVLRTSYDIGTNILKYVLAERFPHRSNMGGVLYRRQ